MKNLLFIISLVMLFSCSVQKRKYQKGFYVSNSKHKKEVQKKPIQISKNEIEHDNLVFKTNTLPTSQNNDLELSASANSKPIDLIKLNSTKVINPEDSLCDQITLRNGDEIKVKVLEITPLDVKYKKCNMPDGPLYIVKKADVFMIKYPNGTKEVFKAEPVYNSVPNQYQELPQNTYKGPKKMNPYAVASFVLGILGIWPLTGLGSLLAIIFGSIALAQIKERPGKYEGEKLARAGKIMGIVILSILALIIIFVIIIALML